ncbi:hypothetical protein [Dickeya dadantii]|uniref:hypothetical protein n=1 Tax=Dickeya dadantii TaxID=204038 RepID=UPI00254273EF|nr:hypothetical protein [Dickeya dadantii]
MVFRSVIENENRRFIMGQEIMPGALKGNGLLLPFLLYAPVPLRAVGLRPDVSLIPGEDVRLCLCFFKLNAEGVAF